MKILLVMCLITLVAIMTAQAQPKIYTDAEREQLASQVTGQITAELVPQGKAAYDARNYPETIDKMTQVLLVDPNNFDALELRGYAFGELSYLFAEERDFTHGAAHFPNDPTMNFKAGTVLLYLGRTDEAIPYLKKQIALQADYNNYLGNYFLGVSQLYSGDYRGCVENLDSYFSKAQKLYDGDYLYRAECHLGLGNIDLAKADIAKAKAINPNGIWLSFITEIAKKPAKDCKTDAEKMVREAGEKLSDEKKAEAYRILWNGTKCYPDQRKILEEKVILETSSGLTMASRKHAIDFQNLEKRKQLSAYDYWQVSAYYRAALPASVLQAEAVVNGSKYFKKGGLTNFIRGNVEAYLKEAEETGFVYENPDNQIVRRITLLNNALSLDPNNVKALELRARAFLNLGNSSMFRHHAWRDASRALKLNPNSSVAYLTRGAVLGKENNYQAALDEFNKSLAINPNEERALLNRGIVRFALKDAVGAIADMSRAVELKPEVKRYYWIRGGHYEGANRLNEALADYRKAVDRKAGANSQFVIDLLSLEYRMGFKAEADELHAQFYSFWEDKIKNNELPGYNKIAEYQSGILAKAQAQKSQSQANAASQANNARQSAAIAAYRRAIEEYNREMKTVNAAGAKLGRAGANADLYSGTWSSYNSARNQAYKILDTLLKNYGNDLPYDMAEQVKSLRKNIFGNGGGDDDPEK